jgi:D-glycero-D-manno-heptose 1,7-bisphosphate phosphatase
VVIKTLVIDGKPMANHSLEAFEYISGIHDLISYAKGKGLIPILITNQPDIARGLVDKDLVDEINSKIILETGIKDVFMCCHDDIDGCDCRKPLPGLFYQAERLLNIDLESSYMVGDRWRDVQAAQNAGIAAIYLDSHYQEPAPTGVFHRISTLEECKSKIWVGDFSHD